MLRTASHLPIFSIGANCKPSQVPFVESELSQTGEHNELCGNTIIKYAEHFDE
jgi:hypothetical protein